MGKIFLIYFNDGMMHTASDLQPCFFQAANQGELDIIDITYPATPTFYVDGMWREIAPAGQKEMAYCCQGQLNH